MKSRKEASKILKQFRKFSYDDMSSVQCMLTLLVAYTDKTDDIASEAAASMSTFLGRDARLRFHAGRFK